MKIFRKIFLFSVLFCLNIWNVRGGGLNATELTHKASIAGGLNCLVGFGVDGSGIVRYVIVWPNGEKPVIERIPVKQGEGIELRFKNQKVEGPSEEKPVVVFSNRDFMRGSIVPNLDEKRLREILRSSKDRNNLLASLAGKLPAGVDGDPVKSGGVSGKQKVPGVSSK